MLGGTFLMLSYFGCDQSQVQRYLTAKSIDEARQSLMMRRVGQDSAAAADPGDRRPRVRVLPVQHAADAVQPRLRRAGSRRARGRPSYAGLQQAFDAEATARGRAATAADRAAFVESDARLKAIRAKAAAVVKQASGDDTYNDVNYVFPTLSPPSCRSAWSGADDCGDLLRRRCPPAAAS